MPELKQIALVILAAGGSARLGRPKQNLEFRGKTLLQATIDASKDAARHGVASGVCIDTFVVLGANEAIIREKNNLYGCEILFNSNWVEGLSSSIRCAVQVVEDNSKVRYDAALFTVADLALIKSGHFSKLLEAYLNSEALVICSAFDADGLPDSSVLGVPALFRRELFPQLMLLSGDVGARKVIMENFDRLMSVKVDDASRDVDTEADYLQLLSG